MSAKRREIYARLAVQLRTHDRCVKAEKLCPGAMGMYLFLVLQARGELTIGDVLEDAAHASWGAPVTYRIKQLAALISVDLVRRVDDRIVIEKHLEHNDGPEDVAQARAEAADRKRLQRLRLLGHASVPCDNSVPDPPCHAFVPISISDCVSGPGSGSGDPRSEDPTSSPRATPAATGTDPPAWWAEACATVAAGVAPVDDRAARWLEYAASRERKGWSPGQRDAVGWLSQVVRRERREAPPPRSGRGPAADPPPQPTPEQSRQFAVELAARVAARKAKGAA